MGKRTIPEKKRKVLKKLLNIPSALLKLDWSKKLCTYKAVKIWNSPELKNLASNTPIIR